MSETTEALRYVSVDELPDVARARQAVRTEAWQTVHLREQQLAHGQEVAVPLAVDALSTAEYVIEAGEVLGTDSEIYQEGLAGLELDCLRLVAEWYRKKRPEYFPKSRHFFDAETGDFYSHGLSIRQMTENALRPIDNDPEEVERRVNEKVENETPHILRKLGGISLAGVGIRTISTCTNKAINDYEEDQKAGKQHRGYNGYVPEIKKLMIRDIRVDEITGDRFEEQVGLPGNYIDDDYVISEALRRRGVKALHKDKTELQGTQLLVKDDLIDFVELLDSVASEAWCVNVFMGEKVDPDHEKNYGSIRQEALKRQEGLKDMAVMVAAFVMDLASDGVDRRKAPAIVEEFVKKLLISISKTDFSIASQIFDKETALGLKKVAYLESIGNMQAAFELLQEVEKQAPGGGFCGAGSCGLEAIKPGSSESKQMKKLGLNATDALSDKERGCKECGEQKVVYDLKGKKKGCLSCGATAKYK